jgi:hypothetical protein
VSPSHVPTNSTTPSLTLPYEENFDVEPPTNWEPFTNFLALDANRWWAADGAYNYQWDRLQEQHTYWDLSMLNAAGTELWTDYRIVARMKDYKESDLRRGLSGVWFRGSYQNSGVLDGESVGGYYLMMRPFSSDPVYTDRLFLMRIPKDDPAFDAASIVDVYHYSQEIDRDVWYDVVIDVEGGRIEVWFGRVQDGGLVKAIDWTDIFPVGPWSSGTVGFVTYATTARFDYMRVLSPTVSMPVNADFDASPRSGVAPLEVAFENLSEGDYTVGLWDFGDGITSTVESPTHTFTAIGAYTVSLTVSGPGGTVTASRQDYIRVSDHYYVYLPLVACEYD